MQFILKNYIPEQAKTGLPHGQEKLRRMAKVRKSQVKMRVFEKSLAKFLKNIKFCQFNFTKFLNFQCLFQ